MQIKYGKESRKTLKIHKFQSDPSFILVKFICSKITQDRILFESSPPPPQFERWAKLYQG